jgi:hypothetical protein
MIFLKILNLLNFSQLQYKPVLKLKIFKVKTIYYPKINFTIKLLNFEIIEDFDYWSYP